MTTQSTMNKLDALVGNTEQTVSEIRLVLKNWDAASPKLHRSVVASIKALTNIPPAVQVMFLDVSDKAVFAIGELLCPEAQDIVLSEYKQDIPVVLRKVHLYGTISEQLWKYLAKTASAGNLPVRTIKRLVGRSDCPPNFARSAGLSREDFDRAQDRAAAKAQRANNLSSVKRVSAVREEKPKAAKTVKKVKPSNPKFDEDDDVFQELKPFAKAVRPRI